MSGIRANGRVPPRTADAIAHVIDRADARRRLIGLRRALRGARRCTFLVQNDPDPDAIASALALRRTLGLPAVRSPIVTVGRITRPENRRLLRELGLRIRRVHKSDLMRLAPLVLVDVQPPYFGGAVTEAAAVVDHHPTTAPFKARHRDIRTSYGASATMAAEYLIVARPAALTGPVATALLYGIITDTRSLSRSASDEDLRMFAFLFPRADHVALRRIQHPSYGRLALERFGQALEHARVHNGLAYVHLGRLPAAQEHIVAQLAEFCLGMAGAEKAVVSGVFGSNLVMSARALSPKARLGERLRAAFARYGSAGGHPVMAKAVLRLTSWRADHPFEDDAALARAVNRSLRRTLLNSGAASRSTR